MNAITDDNLIVETYVDWTNHHFEAVIISIFVCLELWLRNMI